MHLTLNFVDKYPKKFHLLKKLAFAEVYNLDTDNQVTLLLSTNILQPFKIQGPFSILTGLIEIYSSLHPNM